MRPKPCSLCGQPADFSFVILASTLRISPRRQKSSTSIPICNSCLRRPAERNSPDHHQGLSDALTTARGAFSTALARSPEEVPTDDSPKTCPEPANDAAADTSCRPSLTACNSRHFDDPTDPEGEFGV